MSKRGKKAKATVLFLNSFRVTSAGDGYTLAANHNVKRGKLLVVVALGVKDGNKPFNVREAFDELARANGYALPRPKAKRRVRK